MTALYKIANEYAVLSNSDMDAEMIADTLEGIQGEFEDKAEQLLAIIKNSQSLEAALKAEAKALTDRAKAEANRVNGIKAYMASSMETMEIKKLNAGVHTISTRKGSQSVNVVDLEAIPVDYVEYKTTIAPDKNLIKEKPKAGEKIDGVELVTGKSSLIIK